MSITKNTLTTNAQQELVQAGCLNYTIQTPGLFMWGHGTSGGMGNNTAVNRSSPAQLPGTTWCLVSSASNNIAGIKTDGTLWSWGQEQFGEHGVSTNFAKSSPVQVPGTTWCSISGGYTMLALKTDNTLWAWGRGYQGAIGNNTRGNTACLSSPVQIPGTNWCRVCGTTNQSSALKTDGTLWTWGANYNGFGLHFSSNRFIFFDFNKI